MIPQNLNQQNKTNEKENRMTAELKLKRIAEIELQEVEWLWYPYIPFGKITIIQGDPGEGKTTLGLRIAAACSNGHGFPGMEEREPISVIYQTAEDGLGDTVKPRLMEAEANENLPRPTIREHSSN